MLRPYQQKAIDDLYDWMRKKQGHPCLVLPTGSGKSHIVAALCKDAIKSWPDTHILMLTHQKELIEQNAEKLRQHWPNAPLGIYSASIGKKEIDQITFAGIQSVRNKAKLIGHIDLVLIDEAHLVGHKDEGGYRTFLNELEEINPSVRIVGLSATPYRLGHGLITDKPAIFDALIEPVTITELVDDGYLSPLRSKVTHKKLSVEGVHKRGGEFIESELQKAVDTNDNNVKVVDEVISLAENRKAWLFFCSGVDHASHIKDILNARGIPAECVTGVTPKKEREAILRDFKKGKYRAITNANVLTTGFDYPDIDLIAMLRPTMSPGLYVQMAGRGMRLKSHTDHCLVLDFAGVVETHGPITAVKPPSKGGDGNGEAPVKVCENCNELVHISTPICPACGAEFPVVEKAPLKLHDVDIMGMATKEIWVTGWNWSKHYSRASKIEMIKVVYYGALSDLPVTEYLCVKHDGYAAIKAMQTLTIIAKNTGVILPKGGDIDEVCDIFNNAFPPEMVEYKMDGKYARVINRRFRYAPR
jgi:DNA repair protein RadD